MKSARRAAHRLALVMLVAPFVPAFSREVKLYLDVGPVPARGLLFLPVNVIDHFRGEYSDPDYDEPITVYYTREPIPVLPSWLRRPCPTAELLVVEREEKSTVVYLENDRRWNLFIRFPTAYEDTCGFVDAFVNRFIYFLEVVDDDTVPPFPAVLELR